MDKSTRPWGYSKALAWPLGDSFGTELNVCIHWQFTFFLLIKVRLSSFMLHLQVKFGPQALLNIWPFKMNLFFSFFSLVKMAVEEWPKWQQESPTACRGFMRQTSVQAAVPRECEWLSLFVACATEPSLPGCAPAPSLPRAA